MMAAMHCIATQTQDAAFTLVKKLLYAISMRFFKHFCFKKLMDIAYVFLLAVFFHGAALAQVRDGAGHALLLVNPAQRIVTLSPHATELVFAAGAGSKLVGVAEYSDYPEAAKKIPRVAAAGTVDIERIVALKPDLIVSWSSGVAPAAHAQIRKLGIAVFESEPRTLNSVADEIAALAQLASTGAAVQDSVSTLRARIATLAQRARAANQPRVRVFHQIWERPLMTINGQHIMSDAITQCGGENIFNAAPALTPTVSIEAVIARDPQLISTGVAAGETKNSDPLAQWRRVPTLSATRNNALLILNADKFSRASPRMLDEVERLCQAIEALRGKP
jgi:iron complex transport system substrate-binding protein